MKVNISFNEAMDKTLTDTAIVVRENSVVKAGTLTWNSTCAQNAGVWQNCTSVDFTPTTPFASGSSIEITVSTAATESVGGLSLEETYTDTIQAP